MLSVTKLEECKTAAFTLLSNTDNGYPKRWLVVRCNCTREQQDNWTALAKEIRKFARGVVVIVVRTSRTTFVVIEL
jgi:hypothetical protein